MITKINNNNNNNNRINKTDTTITTTKMQMNKWTQTNARANERTNEISYVM